MQEGTRFPRAGSLKNIEATGGNTADQESLGKGSLAPNTSRFDVHKVLSHTMAICSCQ